MLDDPRYRARWEQKRTEYIAAGISSIDDTADSDGVLIVTRDQTGGGLDASEIARIIDRVVFG